LGGGEGEKHETDRSPAYNSEVKKTQGKIPLFPHMFRARDVELITWTILFYGLQEYLHKQFLQEADLNLVAINCR
jgi:hypothetical protein